jgi:ABC-type branched-subunit amino acid transport system substrate-binding protein
MAALGLGTVVGLRIQSIESRGTAKPGSLGVILPLSGRAGAFGSFALRGLLLAVDPFHDASTEILVENDRNEPHRAVRAVRSLATRGATLAVGPLFGKTSEAAVPAAQAMGLPLVVLSAADLPGARQGVVRLAVTPRMQIEALLDEAMGRRGFRKFAILRPNDPLGATLEDLFWDQVSARGGSITGAETYEPGSTDFKFPIRNLVGAEEFSPDELKQRKAANQPLAHLDFDAVFIPDTAQAAGLVVPELIYRDVRGPVFMGLSRWNDPKLVTLGGNYVEGSLFVDWFWPDSEDPEVTRFIKRYHAAYNDPRPPAAASQAYEAGILVSAPVKALDRGAARDAVFSRQWNGLGGKAKVLESGEVDRKLILLTVTRRQIGPADEHAE